MKRLINMVLSMSAEYEKLEQQKRILDNEFYQKWDEILYPEKDAEITTE